MDASETGGETIGQLKDTLAKQLASMMDVIGNRAENPTVTGLEEEDVYEFIEVDDQSKLPIQKLNSEEVLKP